MAKNIFTDFEDSITLDELNAFSKTFNLDLPEDYKNHILEFNGGEPIRNVFLKEDGSGILIDFFYSLKYGELLLEEIINDVQVAENTISKDYMPFGADPFGNLFCLGVVESNYGKVYRFYFDRDDIDLLSNSFKHFVENTKVNDEGV